MISFSIFQTIYFVVNYVTFNSYFLFLLFIFFKDIINLYIYSVTSLRTLAEKQNRGKDEDLSTPMPCVFYFNSASHLRSIFLVPFPTAMKIDSAIYILMDGGYNILLLKRIMSCGDGSDQAELCDRTETLPQETKSILRL